MWLLYFFGPCAVAALGLQTIHADKKSLGCIRPSQIGNLRHGCGKYELALELMICNQSAARVCTQSKIVREDALLCNTAAKLRVK